jgi:hypothetical protein
MSRRRAHPATALALLAALGPAGCVSGCESAPPPEDAPRVVVSLGHCGVDPLTFDGQVWEAGPATLFDQTNAPTEWVGSGVVTRPTPSELVFRDDSGIEVRFAPRVSEQRRTCA